MSEGLRQPRVPAVAIDMSGGMDSRNKSWLVDENRAVYLENVRIDKPGVVRRREGAASIGACSGATNVNRPGGLFTFYDRATFDNTVLYGVNGGHLYMYPGNSQVLERACGASLTEALHMANQGRWNAKDALFISQAQLHDSNQSLASRLLVIDIDGNFSYNESIAPLCTVWWQGRLWVGGNRVTEELDTLWWSQLNDGIYYSLTNTVRVEPGRGGRITGLLPLRSLTPNLLIFKEGLIAMFNVAWGSSSALIPAPSDALDTIASSIRVVAENIGCIATRSIQYVPGARDGDIFFLAKDGFRAISRAADDTVSGSSLPISAIIQDEIDRINFAYAHKAVSVVIDQKYHCAVPLDGAVENSHVFSYDLVTGAWYLNTWDPKDFTVARLGSATEADRLYMQWNSLTSDSTSSGLITGWHVYRAFSGDVDPNGETIRVRVDTRGFTQGSLLDRKKWEWVGFMVQNANATALFSVQYRIDDGDWNTLGQLMYPAGTGNVITLGEDPLPWNPQGIQLHSRKISLEDVPPGYVIQFRVLQTGATDYSQPSIVMFTSLGRPIDPEFDNVIT